MRSPSIFTVNARSIFLVNTTININNIAFDGNVRSISSGRLYHCTSFDNEANMLLALTEPDRSYRSYKLQQRVATKSGRGERHTTRTTHTQSPGSSARVHRASVCLSPSNSSSLHELPTGYAPLCSARGCIPRARTTWYSALGTRLSLYFSVEIGAEFSKNERLNFEFLNLTWSSKLFVLNVHGGDNPE